MDHTPRKTSHPAILELCHAARFDGQPPLDLSAESVLMILEVTETDIDDEGMLFWTDSSERVALEHGAHLRQIIGPS